MAAVVTRRLSQDLLEEVQVRLPATSLIRFKSVCKTWLSQIESGAFTTMYNHHHQQHPDPSSEELLRRTTTTSLDDLRNMIPELDAGYGCPALRSGVALGARIHKVLGPLSNGIYCITSHITDIIDNCRWSLLSGKIAVCNPGTGQYKFAEPFPKEFRHMLGEISKLRGRPPCYLHLGFGNVDDDYRVVALIQHGRAPFSFLVFIYSFQRGEWKKIVDIVPGKRKVGKPKATDAFDGKRIRGVWDGLAGYHQVFFKGRFHWPVLVGDKVNSDNKDKHKASSSSSFSFSLSVLAFNFAAQSFKLLGGPPDDHHPIVSDDEFRKTVKALVMHDHLAVITQDVRAAASDRPRWAIEDAEIGVWMMMEYGVQESWTRIYSIKNPDYNGSFYSLNGIDYEQSPGGGGGGGIPRIKRLFLDVKQVDGKRSVISCDSVGHQVIQIAPAAPASYAMNFGDGIINIAIGYTLHYEIPGYPIVMIVHLDADTNIYWNIPGISNYIETVQPL